jgi:hypothetical protein
MAEVFEIGVKRQAAGDHYSDWLDTLPDEEKKRPQSPLDSAEAKKTHRKLLDWFYHERAKQADNRLQMAMDADYYDNEQWSAEDAEAVRDRGQVPLVFNEIAPMTDWIIGTERRTRVDWRVLPRAEDDVDLADVKTKVLKYVADVNRTAFVRSQAFADAAKVGIGWVDDGVRDDPTQDILYSRYEDWRNVLWDSSAYDLDLTDARYIFRWRWVDDDVAEAMFPERIGQLRRNMVDTAATDDSSLDQDWYLGEPIARSGSMYAGADGVFGEASRKRIRLIEAQFKMPAKVKIVGDGPLKGAYIGEHDQALLQAISTNRSSIVEKVVMRTHVAVFTETDLISMGPSIYRHNRYSLTPIWCYRRGRDRLPYGVIRRVRDIQQDLNKRASKALFLISTNQIIYDKGAFEDINVAREEADMPDGMIEKTPGKQVDIRRDADQAASQIQMMTLDAQTIQRSAGVNNENLGRQTNAVSGEAIKARQLQGAVGTTEIFDNLRLAVQVQGEKQLSLAEQFYTEEKVVRLTGARGRIEWVKVNQPEMQADGSVRYLNDISSSAADFVVSEADYAGTLRQVMLDGITQMAQRLPPEMAVRLFIIGMEFSDLPNKDELVEEMRRVIGERDPNKEMTPEEAQQAEQQMQAQSEALQMQRESAALALEEQRAKVEKLNAEAAKIMSESQGGNGMEPEYEQALRQIQEQAATKLEAMADQLRKVQMDAANKTMAINRDADVKIEAARIDAASRERVAEIQNAAAKQTDALMDRLEEMGKSIGEVGKQAQEAARAAEAAAKQVEQVGKGAEDAKQVAKEASKTAEQAVKAAEKVSGEVEKVGQSVKQATEKPEKPAPAAPAPQPAPVTINFEAGAIQVDAKTPAASKTITMQIGDKTVKGEIKAGEGDK